MKASTGRDTELCDYIEEALLLDDVTMFSCLNLTLDQVINFIYRIQGYKALSS